MPFRLSAAALVFLLLSGGVGGARAQSVERPAPSGGVLSLIPAPRTTDHSLAVAGRTLHYQAKAGTLSLLSGNGDVTAEVFYVAYAVSPREAASQDRQRPVTFVF